MATLYKSAKRRQPAKSTPASTESHTQVRCGGAWPAAVPLGVEARRIDLSRASLRNNVVGFRCFRNSRELHSRV